MQKSEAGADELIASILEGIEEMKGQEVNLLDLRQIENTVCNYFIVCNGTSNTHVSAIVGSIKKTVGKTVGDKPWHVEGEDNAEWILMDYVNVVVHIFQKHIREYYDIEGLWGDAKMTEVKAV